ncbi:MAG: NUDIX hydrolase [Candidatus Schekmanbacteria bacterium]|nr:NUDIX hydrolase [Candidatus Schekmanbacteria bacterium]
MIQRAQPTVRDVAGKRAFACFPAAVSVYLIDAAQRILLLAHPERKGAWEVINGAMEAGETVLDAACRETREEAGADVLMRPIAVFHAESFAYDASVPLMLSLCVVAAYAGGAIVPGDDMAGSEARWWRLAELAAPAVRVIVPPDGKDLIRRAIAAAALWADDDTPLQGPLGDPRRHKYRLQADGGASPR